MRFDTSDMEYALRRTGTTLAGSVAGLDPIVVQGVITSDWVGTGDPFGERVAMVAQGGKGIIRDVLGNGRPGTDMYIADGCYALVDHPPNRTQHGNTYIYSESAERWLLAAPGRVV